MSTRTRLGGSWKKILLLSGLAAVLLRWFFLWLVPPPGINEGPLLPVVFPDAYGFSDKRGSPPRYDALTPLHDGAPAILGTVFRSTEAAAVPRGYAGPVPVLVGLDGKGTITGVVLLEHNETPSYAAGVGSREFLGQFTGRTVFDPLRLEEDIDGVTRATVTASAVTNGVRISARTIAGEVMGIDVPAESSPPRTDHRAALAFFLLLAALAVTSTVIPKAALRWSSLLLGLLLLGFWQGVYLSTATAVNILLWRWPPFSEHLLWYALVAFALGSALLWRNVYCARMCPFGALQEILNLLSPRSLPAAPDEDRRARNLRIVFLWLVVIAVFLFDRMPAANYEPFSTAFDFKGSPLRWALLAAVLVLALFRHRFWCRYFCPTGLWLQLLGRMRTLNPFD
jgi:hypothetical protein